MVEGQLKLENVSQFGLWMTWIAEISHLVIDVGIMVKWLKFTV